jgi:mRNA-degrading endonuclease RelE of RelBE toxin-antitoxin system
MSYEVKSTPLFERNTKKLAKKYVSLKSELDNLSALLKETPFMGTPLGRNVFKIRLPIASKGKGKSSSARIKLHMYL